MKDVNSIIKRIKTSDDGRVVAKNFGYLTLLQIAGYVFPLITMPYLARVIGPTGFGKIAFASAVIIWAQTIADWGFNYTATRDVAKCRNDLDKVSELFSNVLWSRLLLSFVSFLLLVALIFAVPSFRNDYQVILVTFLLVPGHILFPDWFFQAVEKMKYTTIFNLSIKFLFTAAVFVFVKKPSDYILQPLFTSLGYVLCGCVSLYIISKKWGVKILRPNLSKILSTIKGSTDVFFNNLVQNLYNSASVLILGFFGGNVANGIFDAANKFIGIVTQFLNVLTRSFFPFLSRRLDKHSVFDKINFASALFASFVLFISAPLLIRIFYTPEFNDAIPVLRILAISIVFISLFNSYGINYLIVAGRERTLRNISMVCSVAGLIMAIPLIYYYSYTGAAITILCTRVLLGLSTIWYAKFK